LDRFKEGGAIMKKTKGIVFAAAVLSVLLMVSLAIAAPPGSQPPSSSNQVPFVFPDLKIANLYIVPVNTPFDPNNLGPR
jgi:hypothetical protein